MPHSNLTKTSHESQMNRMMTSPSLEDAQSALASQPVQCYLADNALTFAGGQKLGPAVLTAGGNLTYLRPAAGERLIAQASVRAATSRSAVTQVEISAFKDGQEYVCSVGSGTISAMRK